VLIIVVVFAIIVGGVSGILGISWQLGSNLDLWRDEQMGDAVGFLSVFAYSPHQYLIPASAKDRGSVQRQHETGRRQGG
jgi:hypothetical protein